MSRGAQPKRRRVSLGVEPAGRPPEAAAPQGRPDGLTGLLLAEQPEERRNRPFAMLRTKRIVRVRVVAHLLFGSLLHSTRLRPGLDVADPVRSRFASRLTHV